MIRRLWRKLTHNHVWWPAYDPETLLSRKDPEGKTIWKCRTCGKEEVL